MSRIRNTIIGWRNSIHNTYVTLSRQKFEVSMEWFDQMYSKHYTTEMQSKFDEDLFHDDGSGNLLIQEITFQGRLLFNINSELGVLKKWIDEFVDEYSEMQAFLKKEGIQINTQTRQFTELELLMTRISEFRSQIEKTTEHINTDNLAVILNLIKFNNVGLELVRGFDVNRINEYLESDRFISTRPSEDYPVAIVFRRLSQVSHSLISLNTMIGRLKNQDYMVHGNAGMGKSNLSAYLVTELRRIGSPVILVRGKSFHGNPDEFEKILMRELEVPDQYTLREVLGKINEYGEGLNKRIAIIFDALNETTFEHRGFSKIWENSLDDFVNLVREHPYVYFISTFRTSYIRRIWSTNEIPYQKIELTGFGNKALLKVVELYFKHYNIIHDVLNQSDIFYFRTPLLLDLYCKMLNSKKEHGIQAVLGLGGFVDVFERYISDLSRKVTNDLDLTSASKVTGGISNCSQVMMTQMQDFIELSHFYDTIQGAEVTTVIGSIGHEVLNEYLLYIEESIGRQDSVVHTQQEVGGYLLAKRLLANFANNFDQLSKGDFFTKHIIGDEDDKHQLADDILKFLLALDRGNFLASNFFDKEIIKEFIWLKLEREMSSESNLELRQLLIEKIDRNDINDLNRLLSSARSNLIEVDSLLNMDFLAIEMLKWPSREYEMVWSKYVYQDDETVASELESLEHNWTKLTVEEELSDEWELRLIFAIWCQESLEHTVRDKATYVVYRICTKHFQYLLENLESFAKSDRLFIYQRLCSIAYGICLTRQNDSTFLDGPLLQFAELSYNLQFSQTPIAPSYHFIVIDSLRHIIDLAIHKGVFEIEGEDTSLKINKYKFIPSEEWTEVNEADEAKVAEISSNWHKDGPDPLRGDFVHYTIPRLLKDDGIGRRAATAHVYKRLIKNGYEPKVYGDMPQGIDRNFYFGVSRYNLDGKTDRLGKKYSWNAYFEYAGYLLNKGELPVWYQGDTSVFDHFDRLSDVDLEVSCTLEKFISVKLYKDDLFEHRGEDNWTNIEKYASTRQIWNQEFDQNEYVLLNGYLEVRNDDKYDVRSSLIIDTFLVTKKDILGKEADLVERTIDWKHDLYSGGSISKAYFGELYWADSIPMVKRNRESIPTTETIQIDETIESEEMSMIERFHARQGEKNKTVFVTTSFEVEPGVVEYMWESESAVYRSIRDHVPSPNIGRYLNLKSDPDSFQILDEQGKSAFKSVRYEEKNSKQNLSYLRRDLLKKYLDENDLVLLYQIKQQTYDNLIKDNHSTHYTGMQFFFPHLEE